MTSASPLRIGTRASQLARWQARWVGDRLQELGTAVELVEIATHGDESQQQPLSGLGMQGVFTKRIQQALLDGDVDLAVHSLKDLPTETNAGLLLVAVPPREHAADALVSRSGDLLTELQVGAIVGTGSERRRAQLRHCRHDLEIRPIRGNVDTRLRKLTEGEYDAIVLALAGLRRLGLSDRVTETFDIETMVPAVGQGALGLECRADDQATRDRVQRLDDPASHAAVVAERSLLRTLRGGCSAPIGGYAQFVEARLELSAVVLDRDGGTRLFQRRSGTCEEAERLGRDVAATLLDEGAADLIADARA